VNKFTARQVLKGRKRAGGKGYWTRTDRKSIKNQIREMEKISAIDQFEDCDVEPVVVQRMNYPSRNFAALRNFLMTNIGRPWDDIFSEVAQVFDSRSYEGWYVRKELKDYLVRRDVWRGHSSDYYKSDIFFLDDEGILRYIPRNRRRGVERSYPDTNEVNEFVRAEKRRGYLWILGKYADTTYYTRRIIQRGAHLFWAYNNGCGIFTQKEELSKHEVEFFNRLSKSQKKSIMYMKEARDGTTKWF
jgi:hypothetical protein